MNVEIKSAAFAYPVLVHPDVPDGLAPQFFMSFRPEFRDGQLVALHFDRTQYCFVKVGRATDGRVAYAACSRDADRSESLAVGDADAGEVWDAWPFPPDYDLRPDEIGLKSLADKAAAP